MHSLDKVIDSVLFLEVLMLKFKKLRERIKFDNL